MGLRTREGFNVGSVACLVNVIIVCKLDDKTDVGWLGGRVERREEHRE